MPLPYLLVTPVVDLGYGLPDLFAEPPSSLGELFRQLSYGELSDLKLAQDGAGSIALARRNQVVQLANEALLALHKKFELIRADSVISVPYAPAESEYPLGPLDIQVISMLLADGTSLTFLTHPVPGEVFVYNRKISFPPHFPRGTCQVQLLLQRRHATLLPVAADSDLEQPISLSRELWAALRAYIAGEMYGNMNTADAQAAAGKYRGRYREICSALEATGTPAQQMLDIQKSTMRGFV